MQEFHNFTDEQLLDIVDNKRNIEFKLPFTSFPVTLEMKKKFIQKRTAFSHKCLSDEILKELARYAGENDKEKYLFFSALAADHGARLFYFIENPNDNFYIIKINFEKS